MMMIANYSLGNEFDFVFLLFWCFTTHCDGCDDFDDDDNDAFKHALYAMMH